MSFSPPYPYPSQSSRPTEHSPLLIALNGRINSISSTSSSDTTWSSPSLSALTSLSQGVGSKYVRIRSSDAGPPSWIDWPWNWPLFSYTADSSRKQKPKSEDFSGCGCDEADHCASCPLVGPPGPLQLLESQRRRILAGIWLAQFLSALNLTLVPTMLPSISSEFQSSNEASWAGTAYLLSTSTFTPLYGRLSNLLGRRGAIRSAILLASLGVAICGFSGGLSFFFGVPRTDSEVEGEGEGGDLQRQASLVLSMARLLGGMAWLILGRFVSGMGGGGIFTTSSIITSDMYTERSRGYVQSLGGIFYGLGMGLGGPVGGLITDWFGWRWAFLLQLPFFALAYVLTSCNLVYVVQDTSNRSGREILKRIDYGGSFALLGAVGSFLVFLSMRYNEGLPFSSPALRMSLISGIFFSIAFIIIELFVAVEPILPAALLTQKIPVLVGLSNALVAVTNLSVTYYYPTWFQVVRGETAAQAGLHLLPNSVCISAGSFFAGWAVKKWGRYKKINVAFGILPFVGAVLMTRMKEDSGALLRWFCIIPLGFGNAIVLQTMYVALVSNLPESQMAVGTGFAQLLRGLGQVAGLASASAIFQARLSTTLRVQFPESSPVSDDLINRLQHSIALVGTLPEPLRSRARVAYADSLNSVFIWAACASMAAYLARLPIPDKKLEDAPRPVTGSPTSISAEVSESGGSTGAGYGSISSTARRQSRDRISDQHHRFEAVRDEENRIVTSIHDRHRSTSSDQMRAQ